MTPLYDACVLAGFVNGDDFVTIEKNAKAHPGEGNGLLQSGLVLTIMACNGGTGQKEKDVVDYLIKLCLHPDFAMLWRSPYKHAADDNQNWDDYYGALAMCFFTWHWFPTRFLAFCEQHRWCVDIQHPEKWSFRYWFGRSSGFKGFVRLCAGTKPTLFNWLGLWASIFVSCYTLQSDACMRNYCVIAVAANRSRVARFIARIWFRRVRARYGTVGAAFSDYFKGMEHPVTQGDWN